MVTKPTINLNGTSPKELLDEQLLAIDALRVAISTLAIAAPNPRDCQTAPTGAFAQAAALTNVMSARIGKKAGMRDQPGNASMLIAALDNLPNGDADVVTVLTGMGLRRAAPSAIQRDPVGCLPPTPARLVARPLG